MYLLDKKNVLRTFRISRLYNLGLLEAACCDYMAQNLDKVIDKEEFASLVLADAQDCQEMDAICILDEIRFHLFKNELPGHSSLHDEGYVGSPDDRFRMLDDLVVQLGIEA